jgi:hypothetical protein
MQAIVQLSQKEYEELSKQASYNKNQIEELAEKMYREKGTFEIKINMEIEENDWEGHTTVCLDSYIRDYDRYGKYKYEIPYSEKKQISEFVNNQLTKKFERNFGKQIHNRNLYKDKILEFQTLKNKFICLAVFGWLAALALVLIAILK